MIVRFYSVLDATLGSEAIQKDYTGQKLMENTINKVKPQNG